MAYCRFRISVTVLNFYSVLLIQLILFQEKCLKSDFLKTFCYKESVMTGLKNTKYVKYILDWIQKVLILLMIWLLFVKDCLLQPVLSIKKTAHARLTY